MELVRVLHIVSFMGLGGLETMLMNYYRCIDREKVQFDFLVHRKDIAYYDQEIENMGGKIYRIQRLNPFNPSYINELNNFFKDHSEYKIVHCHLDCMSSVPLKVAMRNGIPVRIAHCHSNNQDYDLKYLIKMHFKTKIKKYATKLFACSVDAGKWTFGTDNFEVFPNAIELKKYKYNVLEREHIREELGLKDSLVIGHVGRFSPAKNHIFLIDIFSEIVKLDEQAKLLLIGTGTLVEEIRKKVHNLNLDNQVLFLGTRSDVSKLLQAMDAFVFPSLYEGFGIVAIEAQAAALPCIISDKVSSDCIKTNLVTQISVDESPATWARKVVDAAKILRCDVYDIVKNSGLDINENARLIEKFYLKCEIGETDIYAFTNNIYASV